MAMRSVDEIPKTYQRKGERTNSVTTARIKDEENVVDVICTLPLSRKDAPSNPNLDLMVRDASLWQGAGQFHGALGT